MLLKVEDLSKSFGHLTVLNDLTFHVREGELKSIIGPNGAGKSTLFNVITGRFPPDKGTIEFHGRNVTNAKPHVISSLGLARSFQINNFFLKLTVFENVRLAAQSRLKHPTTIWRNSLSSTLVKDKALEILEAVGLADLQNELSENLSYGDQRKLEIALALGTDPSLLMLDEPTSGMSRFESQTMIELVKSLSQRVTIVLIEHDIDFVMSVSDNIMVIHYGRKIAEGTPDEIALNEEVQNVYLGC
jgi:ABC-type branched-subunit amino acid transport system ATPase component